MTDEYTSLEPFATTRQMEYIEAIRQHGGYRAAGRAMGLNHSTVVDGITKLKRAAAKRGHSPDYDMNHTVPSPFEVKGVSTLYGPDGQVKAQWVKSRLGPDNIEDTIEAMEKKLEGFSRFKPIASPDPYAPEELTNLIGIFDAHIGEEITSADPRDAWDTGIAKRTILGAIANLISRLSPARRLVLVFGGDIMHYDGPLPVTPTSRHVLHSSGDAESMADTTIDVACSAIDFALTMHEQVDVVWAEGNHDIIGSLWMRKLLSHVYADEPRLNIVQPMDRTAFFALSIGKNMIGVHHGHGVAPGQMPSAFSMLFRKQWGEAEHAYAHCGHRHHKGAKDKNGMTVIQHPALPPSDAYAKGKALQSTRGALGFTYHDEDGQIDELTFTPRMLRA